MPITISDSATVTALTECAATEEVRAADGRLLGEFVPAKLKMTYPEFGLTDEELARRSDHYLMESRQGKLRRVVHLNARGTPVPEQDDFKWTSLHPNYDENGVLMMIEYRNQSDQVILQRQFRPRLEENGVMSQDVSFTRGKEHGLLPLAAQDASERQTRPYDSSGQTVRAEITTHRLIYGKDGLVAEIRYLDPYNSPAPDSEYLVSPRLKAGGDGR